MKKNNDKKFSFQLKEWLFTGILGFLIFISSPQLMFAKDATTPSLSDEAIILFDKEKQLFSARQKFDWEKIHAFQHPVFRKKVSVNEIKYFEGWVTEDYREKSKQNAHISGSYVPSVDYIIKNPNKKDPLGFPVPRRYKWSENSFFKVKTLDIKKYLISTDGKYAKVEMMVKGRERLNPALVRGDFEFDAQYPLTDYWEKVDGNWVITLLSKPVNTSGAGFLLHYLPNDKSGWGKMDFVEINPVDLVDVMLKKSLKRL